MMWFLSRFSISRDFMSKRVEGILSSRLSNSSSSVTRDRLYVCVCVHEWGRDDGEINHPCLI